MQNRRWLLWGGIASVSAGAVLILLALLTMPGPLTGLDAPIPGQTSVAAAPSLSPSPPLPTLTPSPTNTPTPDPLIPTPTPAYITGTLTEVVDEGSLQVSPTPSPVIIAPPASTTAAGATVVPPTLSPSSVATALPSLLSPTATPAPVPLPSAMDVDAIWRGRYRWGI
ncbi:MAG: hypothetical protein PVI59_07885, partial [Anaerolineae bacterium]